MPKIKIVVDPKLCIGAAACVTVAPQVFQLNKENKAEILDPGGPNSPAAYERVLEVSLEELENIRLAAESCPVRAIFIYDEGGSQIFP